MELDYRADIFPPLPSPPLRPARDLLPLHHGALPPFQNLPPKHLHPLPLRSRQLAIRPARDAHLLLAPLLLLLPIHSPILPPAHLGVSSPHARIDPLRRQHLRHPHEVHEPLLGRDGVDTVRRRSFRRSLPRRGGVVCVWTERGYGVLGRGFWVYEFVGGDDTNCVPVRATLCVLLPLPSPLPSPPASALLIN